MLWCFAGILKFLQIFGQGTPHFHFALSSTNCVAITAPLSIVTTLPFLLPALSLFFFSTYTRSLNSPFEVSLTMEKCLCSVVRGSLARLFQKSLVTYPVSHCISGICPLSYAQLTSNTQLAPNSTVVPLVACNGQLLSLLYLICFLGDFPGGQGVKTLHFQCRGHRFDPWSGN